MISFLSSPYSNDDAAVINERVYLTAKATAILLRRGEFIFSPILHGHAIVERESDVPGDWKFWQAYCKKFIDVSDKVFVLIIEGWDKSIGIGQELLHAQLQKKKIIYITFNDDFTDLIEVSRPKLSVDGN